MSRVRLYQDLANAQAAGPSPATWHPDRHPDNERQAVRPALRYSSETLNPRPGNTTALVLAAAASRKLNPVEYFRGLLPEGAAPPGMPESERAFGMDFSLATAATSPVPSAPEAKIRPTDPTARTPTTTASPSAENVSDVSSDHQHLQQTMPQSRRHRETTLFLSALKLRLPAL